AEGTYVRNRAHGMWTFFHPSGNVAAVGRFTRGVRTGTWRFYNDSKDKLPLAVGAFAANGAVTGTWTHYDTAGHLLARTYREDGGDRIDVVPTADGITHQMHQWRDFLNGPVETYDQELERLASGGDQIYVHTSYYRSTGLNDTQSEPEIIYDPAGFKLVKTPLAG